MENDQAHDVFVIGGTGYIGTRLIAALLARGHRVRALARAQSMTRIPAGAAPIVGDALDPESIIAALRPAVTVVHLIGTPHPNPSKALEFLRVDLGSARAAVAAASRVGVAHFVYVSVAQPAPVMKTYVAARVDAESAIAKAGLTATVLRPWYVIGPGHRWPLILKPAYAIAELIPSLRADARRLGLVTLRQMVDALVRAVENPPARGSIRVVDVPAIRGS